MSSHSVWTSRTHGRYAAHPIYASPVGGSSMYTGPTTYYSAHSQHDVEDDDDGLDLTDHGRLLPSSSPRPRRAAGPADSVLGLSIPSTPPLRTTRSNTGPLPPFFAPIPAPGSPRSASSKDSSFPGRPDSASLQYSSTRPVLDRPSSSYAPSVRTTSMPWVTANGEGMQLPEDVKQQRMQQLEKEMFGEPVGEAADEVLEEELILEEAQMRGRRSRGFCYAIQGLTAAAAGASSIYAALFIHPNPPAPTAGTFPTYALDALSALTIVGLTYIHFLSSWLQKRREAQRDPTTIFPMTGTYPQQPKSKNRRNQQRGPVPVQVNLVVHPSMFWGPSGPPQDGGQGQKQRATDARKARAGQRLRALRQQLKKLLGLNILLTLLWVIVFVLIVMGEKCPPGAYDGWCTAWNVATACAVFVVLSSICLLYFNIKSLRDTRLPSTEH